MKKNPYLFYSNTHDFKLLLVMHVSYEPHFLIFYLTKLALFGK